MVGNVKILSSLLLLSHLVLDVGVTMMIRTGDPDVGIATAVVGPVVPVFPSPSSD